MTQKTFYHTFLPVSTPCRQSNAKLFTQNGCTLQPENPICRTRKSSAYVEAVKQIIKTEKEWKVKLEREIFSDADIQKTRSCLLTLFHYENS